MRIIERLSTLFVIVAMLVAGITPAAAITPTEAAKLIPSDGTGPSSWGDPVAISGDTAVVGSACCGAVKGLAEVFVRNGDTWSSDAVLMADDTAIGVQDLFGEAVAIDGDVIVVGADSNSPNAAYVYRRSGGIWEQEAKLTPSTAGSGFGASVAISNDTIVVGRYGMGEGGAFVFQYDGIFWSEQAFLPSQGDAFGFAVAVDGDAIVVGDFGSGAAHYYSRSGTTWSLEQTIENDWVHFGQAVAVEGADLVVGAPAPMSGLGAAFTYTLVSGTWEESASLTPSGSESGDFFGGSVSLDGGTLLIGASSGFASNCSGAAYVFSFDAGAWTEDAVLYPDGAAAGCAGFGESVSLDGDTALIGAPGDENGVAGVSGAAYAFNLEADGANAPPNADAGPDQTVEWASGGAVVTLDGLGSSDPDGDSLSYDWAGGFGGSVAAGSTPTVTFSSLGQFEVTLTVDDGNGGTDSDSMTVSIVDTTAPEAAADLDTVWADRRGGLFIVAFECQDSCDTSPDVTATLNGVPVENGQEVHLRRTRRPQSYVDSTGVLHIEARRFELVVTCTDDSGNETVVAVEPIFRRPPRMR